ncbi:hypothetical protein FRIGORI9N_260015 [Frigoribacterium sp. 9N]|nr:hypothetical protein FRIGORI9N_260015 [Frigoribacterium sp. 9N]
MLPVRDERSDVTPEQRRPGGPGWLPVRGGPRSAERTRLIRRKNPPLLRLQNTGDPILSCTPSDLNREPTD